MSVCATNAMALKQSVVVRNVEEVKGDVHASNKNFLSLGEINTYLSIWTKHYWHLRIKGGNKTASVEEIKFSPEGGISMI